MFNGIQSCGSVWAGLPLAKSQWQNRMASAVALEADRISSGIQPAYTQGAAYKAEWDRRGSNALTLCRDVDVDIVEFGVRTWRAEFRRERLALAQLF